MSAPLISVIIPAYNAAAFIGQAIQSVLDQTLTDLEVVVVDDKSTDNTNDVVAAYAARDSRVRHFPGVRNLGPGGARNLAINHARGKWIAALDADDWFHPTRLEKLLNAADRAGLPVAVDNQKFVTDSAGSWDELLVEADRYQRDYLTADDLLQGDRLYRNAKNLGLLKPMVQRELLTAHAICYDEAKVSLALGEDFYFLLKCARYAGRISYVSEPLYYYRTYAPMSFMKRLPMEGIAAIRTMHARYSNLFSAEEAPVTANLMEQRRLEIERYIRMKKFVEPLKQAQLGVFAKQVANDPGGAVLLMRNAIGDPGAVVLLLRHFARHARHCLTARTR